MKLGHRVTFQFGSEAPVNRRVVGSSPTWGALLSPCKSITKRLGSGRGVRAFCFGNGLGTVDHMAE